MSYWRADDDTQIHFEFYPTRPAAGPGHDTLLLLPGMLGSIESQWRRFLQPLSANFRLLLVDVRGHGRSHNNEPTLRPERMVADITGLLDHLDLDTVHVAGYSLGGYLGLMLHLGRPGRVKSLLMHAVKFYWQNNAVAKMRQQLDPDKISVSAPDYANRLALAHGGTHWRLLVRQSADLIATLHQDGLTEKMAGRAQCPVLVSVGDRDQLVNVMEAQRLSRQMPNGALLVLPNVSHPFQTVGLNPLLGVMQHFHKS